MLKKKMLVGSFLGAIFLSSVSFGKVIQIKGSDTILNVSQYIAEEYMLQNKNARIAVTGGGSGTGISSIINGTADIAMASRNIKDKEIKLGEEKGIKIEEVVLGMDGITVIANESNNIKNLTSEQLAKIFRGEITNWKEVGGEDGEIIVLSRDSSSGTHEFFKEHIVREENTKKEAEYGKNVLYMPSNEAIKQEIRNNKNGIGYIGMGYVDNTVEALNIDGIPATIENVKNKKYPIAREVYWYTVNAEGNSEIKDLVDYALSPNGQAIVAEEGFVPVK